jgi:hypothetical protein
MDERTKDMALKSGGRSVLALIILNLAAGIEVVDRVRYSTRLPDHWLGLEMNAATIVGLLTVAGLVAGGRLGTG